MIEEQTKALAASADAAEATAELIRFAREGDGLGGMAFYVEVAVHLAAALQAALEIELPRLTDSEFEDPTAEREAAQQLLGALGTFMAVWA